MYRILVVDDEAELRKQLTTILRHKGYETDEAADGLEALEKLRGGEYPLVLCDVRMPNMTGLELLKQIQHEQIPSALALITAHGSIHDAIVAMREGAFDYIEKPIEESSVSRLIEKAERAYHMLHLMADSAPQISPGDGKECVGQSRGMKRVFQLIEKLTRVNTSVLIRGENGTGKELVARAIHYNSPRKDAPFVAVNCAAIPESLAESEFFGHEKGAFTGAEQRKIGKFQFAAGGTLFLDEIGDISPLLQVKLLRVLQEHTFTPVGSNREVKADVRIVAATNQDLEKLVKEGKFREDLYYRLNVLPIFLPPLRERCDDIPALVHHFIDKFNLLHGSRITGISEEALDCFEHFAWPGNIRELENAIEHAFVVETSDRITYFSLPEYLRRASKHMGHFKAATLNPSTANPITLDLDWEKRKEDFEKDFIVNALKTTKGRINLTAEQANIPKNTLLRKIKKYNINPRDFESNDMSL